MSEARLRIMRGDPTSFAFAEYVVPLQEGMVVLDALHWIQAKLDPTLAVRWNCKAGKCGSCGMEVNGKPKLGCMTEIGRAHV